MKKAVTIISGGMDSGTLAYLNHSQGIEQTFLSFDYGQRHVKELQSAAKIATALGEKHYVISLRDLGVHLVSSLTQKNKLVPEGHYALDNMSQTVVPNRNAIMLSMAWGIAISEGASAIFYGAHAGDHAIYPDCRQPFIDSLEEAFYNGTEVNINILAPFIQLTKAGILQKGLALKVPYEMTWTCYNGREKACGRCGCCVERLQAFDEVGVKDPLEYEDRVFYKQALKEYAERTS